jgi:hypothetical protein
MELTEKVGLVGFRVLSGRKWRLTGCEAARSERHATRGLKRSVADVYSTVLGDPKWKSQVPVKEI